MKVTDGRAQWHHFTRSASEISDEKRRKEEYLNLFSSPSVTPFGRKKIDMGPDMLPHVQKSYMAVLDSAYRAECCPKHRDRMTGLSQTIDSVKALCRLQPGQIALETRLSGVLVDYILWQHYGLSLEEWALDRPPLRACTRGPLHEEYFCSLCALSERRIGRCLPILVEVADLLVSVVRSFREGIVQGTDREYAYIRNLISYAKSTFLAKENDDDIAVCRRNREFILSLQRVLEEPRRETWRAQK